MQYLKSCNEGGQWEQLDGSFGEKPEKRSEIQPAILICHGNGLTGNMLVQNNGKKQNTGVHVTEHSHCF